MYKRPKLISLKNHLLALILSALMLPPVIVLVVAAYAHFSQERAMEAAVSSYVQDLAESMAYRLNSESQLWNFPADFFVPDVRYRIFSWGPSMPGWVAYIGNDGKIILSSPGAARSIGMIWRPDLPIGSAVRLSDRENHEYTLAVYPVAQGGYVVAAVSWNQLLGNLVRIGRLWPVMLIFVSLGSFWAIRLVWRRLISPLKGLAAEIDGLRMGKDLIHTADTGAVLEIESVRSALARLAKAAVDRDSLRKSYVMDIVKVQEQERLDMAREIHDGPLQDITALLQQVHMSLEKEEYSPERVKKVERLARAVVRELRGLCDELAPPWVDLGLADALTELAERLSQNYDIHVSADIDAPFETNPEQTLSLLRIFQEAVSNAVRHGEASEVRAQIREDGGRLVFEIKDNGKGFEAGFDSETHETHEKFRLEGHRGLANMTERMSLLGGTLKVRSAPGEGTSVLCALG